MSVVLAQEELGACQRKLTIEVPTPAVEAETERVVDQFRRSAKLPGFRPGKVPRELVRKRFRSDIEKEIVERLVPRYWKQAEAETGLVSLLPPELTEVDFELGTGMTFVAQVETRPEIELRNIRDFELPDPPVTAGEEEIDEALADLRRQAGTWKEVGRAAARGDRITGEMSVIDGDGPGKVRFEVGGEGVWEELTLAATGLSAGGETRFERRMGEEERSYVLRVEEVAELELPELDQSLAERFDATSIDDLRERIGQQIGAAKASDRRRVQERALLDQLCERHPFELPGGVVRREVESLLREYAEGLVRRGVDLEHTSLDWSELGEKMRPQAERRVQARLLLDAIADAEAIEVSEEKLEAVLADIARANQRTSLVVRRDLDKSGKLATLRQDLRRHRVVDRLLGDEQPDPSEGEPPAVTAD